MATEFIENHPYDELQVGQSAELQRTLTRDYPHLMRTDREKAEVRSRFIVRGPATETKIIVSKHHPDIHKLFPREDGTLWVLTSRGRKEPPDGALALFDVFDAQGRFVRKVASCARSSSRVRAIRWMTPSS